LAPPDLFQSGEDDPLQFLPEAGLVEAEVGKLDADRVAYERLVSAALGAEADARRGAEDDEAGAGIDAVEEGVQPALDERVVERADREEHFAVELVRESELAKSHEQVVLGDSELYVLPLFRFLPLEG